MQWTESDEKRVSLKNLQFEASGVYICEVTTDNPIYTKPSEEEYLVVMRKYISIIIIKYIIAAT